MRRQIACLSRGLRSLFYRQQCRRNIEPFRGRGAVVKHRHNQRRMIRDQGMHLQ